MKIYNTLFLVLIAALLNAKPLTFVTYHATSQYYPNISAAEIAAIVPYGGKLKLKVEPEADSTHAKKKLKAGNLLSEGDVQFGGTEETKGSLELKNVSGTAKSLETVDAYVKDLYLYNIQFPTPTEAMHWENLSVKTQGNGTYNATFLTMGAKTGPKLKCYKDGDPQMCPQGGADNCGIYKDFKTNSNTDTIKLYDYNDETFDWRSAIAEQVPGAGVYYDVFYEPYNYTLTASWPEMSSFYSTIAECESVDLESYSPIFEQQDPNKCKGVEPVYSEYYINNQNQYCTKHTGEFSCAPYKSGFDKAVMADATVSKSYETLTEHSDDSEHVNCFDLIAKGKNSCNFYAWQSIKDLSFDCSSNGKVAALYFRYNLHKTTVTCGELNYRYYFMPIKCE